MSKYLYVCATSKPEKVAFFYLFHNHYLKTLLGPVLLPVTEIIGGDSATALLQFTNPLILFFALILLLLAFLYFMFFLLELKVNEITFFLWVLCGFGLFLSVLDGGIFSMAGYVNILFLSVLLVNKFIKSRFFFVFFSLVSIILLKNIIDFFCFLLVTGKPSFSSVLFILSPVFVAPLLTILILVCIKKFKVSIFTLFILILLFSYFLFTCIFLSPFVPQEPNYQGVTLKSATLIFNENKEISLLPFGEVKKINNTSFYVSLDENTSFWDFCLTLEENNLNPLILVR